MPNIPEKIWEIIYLRVEPDLRTPPRSQVGDWEYYRTPPLPFHKVAEAALHDTPAGCVLMSVNPIPEPITTTTCPPVERGCEACGGKRVE